MLSCLVRAPIGWRHSTCMALLCVNTKVPVVLATVQCVAKPLLSLQNLLGTTGHG